MSGTPALDPAAIRAAVLQRREEEQPANGQHGQAAPRPLRFLSLPDMLNAPQPPDWIIRGYLEGDTLAILFGESGSMKSFVALDMALCVASGRPWHSFTVPKPGLVLYIAAEGSRGLAKRIKAFVVAHPMDMKAPLFTLPEPVQFLDQTEAEQAEEAIAAVAETSGPPRLIIIDTLARCFGGDENSSQEMSAFVAALDHLRVRFKCAVLVVHHSGLQEKNRARGSSVLRAALDWEYRLTKMGDFRELVCSKSKDHEPPQTMLFKPEVIFTGWTDPETREQVTSVVLNRATPEETPGKMENVGQALKGANRIAFDALKLLCRTSNRVHLTEWRKEAHRLGISSSEEVRAKNMAFKRAVSALLDAGRVGVSDDYYWPVEEHKEQTGNMFPLFLGGNKEHGEHPSLEGVPVCSPPQGSRQVQEEGAA